MKTNKITGLAFALMIISLIFIIPYNISLAYAADDTGTILGTSSDSYDAKRGQVQQTCGFTQPTNVKDSLLLSVIYMCIPGVLEKVQEWRLIECQRVVCHYEAVKSSLDPTFCDKQASYSTCTYIWGEVFAIPPMSIVDNMRNFVAEIWANPVGLAYSAVMKVARKYSTSCAAKGASCSTVMQGAVMIVLGVNDIISAIQTFEDISENGIWPESEDSACEQVEDIISEMKDIIAAIDEDIESSSNSTTTTTSSSTTTDEDEDTEDTTTEDEEDTTDDTEDTTDDTTSS